MNLGKVLSGVMKGISTIPYLIAGAEAIHGTKTGATKKATVLNLTDAAIGVSELVMNKDIIDEQLFHKGLDMVLEGQLLIQKSLKKD